MRKHFKWKYIVIAFLLVLAVSFLLPTDMKSVKASVGLGPTNAFYDIDNFNYTLQSIDGGTVTTQAQGKPKLLIFFDRENEDAQRAIREMCLANDYKGVDIIAIETAGGTKAEVNTFKGTYTDGKEYLKFCYSTEGYHDYMWNYVHTVEPDLFTVEHPILVYIDSDDRIQYITMARPTSVEIVANLNRYCKAGLENQMAPEIYKVTNVVSGVHIYWKAAEGAEKYSIYRTDPTSVFAIEWVGDTTSTHYIDTNVKSGVTYDYMVIQMVTLDGTESGIHSSTNVRVPYVATPDINLRVNRAAGIGLGWNKIEGATGYAIYRKPYSGNAAWARVATITNPNTTTWNDTSVKANNGTVYRYTIRALAGEKRNILSGCRTNGRTMTRLTSRTLTGAVKASATSIKCTWGTTSQANGYEIRFMVGNKVYNTYKVSNYKIGTKTFAGLKAGQAYKIQVRSYKTVSGVGTFYSAWSTAKTVSL